MAGKTIGQLTSATAITTADLIEIEQGGSSKNASVNLIKGVIEPLSAQIDTDTTYTVPDGPQSFQVVIPAAYLVASTTASVSLTLASDVSSTETVIIPLYSSSVETSIVKSTIFNIYVDSSGNVYSNNTPIVTVRAEYKNQTVTTTATALKYITKTTDTHSAYNITTGRYTFPVNGIYLVISDARSSTTSYGRIALYKNNVFYSYMGQTPNANNITGRSVEQIEGLKDEYIDIRAIDYGLVASTSDSFIITLTGIY